MSGVKLDFERAKKASLYDLWPLLGLKGTPANCCSSPFREDRRPSFFITPDGTYWKDLARTEERGDCIDFVERALSCSTSKAVNTILEYMDQGMIKGTVAREMSKNKPLPCFQDFSRGCDSDLESLSKIRGIKKESLARAVELGILRFGDYNGKRVWVITDDQRLCAQIRHLDGTTITVKREGHDDLQTKAKTLFGSWTSHCVGLAEAENGIIALCEGGPDLLSAIQIFDELGVKIGVRFGAMLGNLQKISEKCLPLFKNSKVIIFNHQDEAGTVAYNTWAEQIRPFAKTVFKFDFKALHLDAEDLNETIIKYDPSHYQPWIRLALQKK